MLERVIVTLFWKENQKIFPKYSMYGIREELGSCKNQFKESKIVFLL